MNEKKEEEKSDGCCLFLFVLFVLILGKISHKIAESGRVIELSGQQLFRDAVLFLLPLSSPHVHEAIKGHCEKAHQHQCLSVCGITHCFVLFCFVLFCFVFEKSISLKSW